MANDTGCLVDFEEDENVKGSVNQFSFLDDFRRCCRVLNVTFSTHDQIIFKNDASTYIKAMGSKWEPIHIKETRNGGDLWSYEGQFVPKNSFKINNELLEDTESLTKKLELEFADGSEAMKLPVPLKNISYMRLAEETRIMSIHLNKDNLKQAIMYYYDGSCAVSGTLEKILTGEATELDGTSIQYFQEYTDNRYELLWEQQLKNLTHLTYDDYLNKLVGRVITVRTNFPLQIFHNYKLPEKFSHDEITNSMVCIRQYVDSNMQTHPYYSTLAEIIFP